MLDDLQLYWKLWRAWVAVKEGTMDTKQIFQLLQVLSPFIGTALTAMLKRYRPKIPSALLPVISTVLGALTAGLGGATPFEAGVLGLSSVGVREVYDQAKQHVAGPTP